VSQRKPKLRMPPSQADLLEQQEAANRLLKLEQWTEEPSNPPASGFAAVRVAAVPVVVVEPAEPAAEPVQEPELAIKVTKPAVAPKPWEGEGVERPHPYHIVFTEREFQRIDFVWKRKNFKSMKEWVLHTLRVEADKQLKLMGEK